MLSTNSSAENAARAAEQAAITRARAVDVTYSIYFATGIIALIAIYTIINWSRILFNKYGRSEQSLITQHIAKIFRSIHWLNKGFNICGTEILPDQILLATAYFGFNLICMFTNVDISLGTMFAKRLTLCNLCLVVFLGLKNTPLSPFTGRSYESVSVLHRGCGYLTILLMMLHALNVIAGLAKEHMLAYLMEPGQYAGIVGAFGLLMIGTSSNRYFRKRQYEVFYILHLTLVTTILIAVFLHIQKISWSAIVIVIVAASLWFVDRLVRFSRWVYYGYGNHCTLIPLPGGATRVVTHRYVKATPGSHAFLWIPNVRKFQVHPFTLLSNTPAEFIISPKNGFTRAMHEYALQNPHKLLRAAIEGPYGRVPNPEEFDMVVLLSGGSGITFAMALAMKWLNKIQNTDHKGTLRLVWATKKTSHLRWFDSELKDLHRSPSVHLQIHVTAKDIAEGKGLSLASTPSEGESRGEKAILCPPKTIISSLQGLNWADYVTYGRPDVEAIIKSAVDGLSPEKKVLIAACGPSPLLSRVRLATRACISDQAPSVKLHVESFGR